MTHDSVTRRRLPHKTSCSHQRWDDTPCICINYLQNKTYNKHSRLICVSEIVFVGAAPARASVTSSKVGCGLFLSNVYMDITIPGVQNPHWDPWAFAIRSWKTQMRNSYRNSNSDLDDNLRCDVIPGPGVIWFWCCRYLRRSSLTLREVGTREANSRWQKSDWRVKKKTSCVNLTGIYCMVTPYVHG